MNLLCCCVFGPGSPQRLLYDGLQVWHPAQVFSGWRASVGTRGVHLGVQPVLSPAVPRQMVQRPG